MKKLIHSPAPWFSVQYANSYFIQTEDTYSESAVMDIEVVGEDIAETNAIIASKAPDMYEAMFELITKGYLEIDSSIKKKIETILKDIETLKTKT